MSAYISSTKISMRYDDIPFWFEGFLRRCRIGGNTAHTVLTYYSTLREFCRYVAFVQENGHTPSSAFVKKETDDAGKIHITTVNELNIFRTLDITWLEVDILAQQKKRDIQRYVEFVSDILNNEAATINKKLSTIKVFYDYLVNNQTELNEDLFADEDDLFRKINCIHFTLESNPAEQIPCVKQRQKQPVFLPESAVMKLLESISGPDYERDYAIILLFLTTGIRLSELCAINLQDINGDRIKIKGKGNKQRTVFLTQACAMAIEDYMESYRAPLEEKLQDKNALFVSSLRCQRIGMRAVQIMFKRQLRIAGLDPEVFTVHKLRHTAATMLVNNGADLLVVQELLGHESPVTTAQYTHLSPLRVREAVQDSPLSGLGVRKTGLTAEELDFVVASDLAQNKEDFAVDEEVSLFDFDETQS